MNAVGIIFDAEREEKDEKKKKITLQASACC